MPDDMQGTASTIHTSSEQLRLFAFEAEVNENFEMAAVYYEEVLNISMMIIVIICESL